MTHNIYQSSAAGARCRCGGTVMATNPTPIDGRRPDGAKVAATIYTGRKCGKCGKTSLMLAPERSDK